MSKRHGMRSVKGDNVPVKKIPPSHEILERILGVNHVLMCRSCRFKLFCKKVLSCEEENRIEAKLSLLTNRVGGEEIKKLTPPELIIKMDGITDKEAYEYMRSIYENNSLVVREGASDETEIDETDETIYNVEGPDGPDYEIEGDEVQEQTGEDSNTPAVSENENSK